MKKLITALSVTAIATGAWAVRRLHKYPLDKELRCLNVSMPLFMLNPKMLMKSNASIRKMEMSPPPSGIIRKTETITSNDGASVKLTIYEPEKQDEPLPCLVYYHGGGLVLEDADYIHTIVTTYSKNANCKILFPHYRTADEHPFPTPFFDCYAALEYAWSNAEALGIDPKRIAVGGDSAGGTVAAAAALKARDDGEIPLCFQLLLYPATDIRLISDSMKKFTDSPVWNAKLTKKIWTIILKNGDCGMTSYISPLLAKDFSHLPAAYVETEEFDCLHDEGVAYAEALDAAGNPVTLCDVKGTCHGFDVLVHTNIVQKQIKIRSHALQKAFWG